MGWWTAAARWPAVLDGGAAALNVFFLNFFSSFSSTPSPLHVSGLKISKHERYGPRSEQKEKEKKLYFFVIFGAVHVLCSVLML